MDNIVTLMQHNHGQFCHVKLIKLNQVKSVFHNINYLVLYDII